MRRFTLIILILLFWFPLSAQAAECSDNGYTIVFINGIFNTKPEADANRLALQGKLGFAFRQKPLSVILKYNESHLAGIGDLIETNFPVFDDYDLNTILMQMHADVTTRKILLVGH